MGTWLSPYHNTSWHVIQSIDQTDHPRHNTADWSFHFQRVHFVHSSSHPVLKAGYFKNLTNIHIIAYTAVNISLIRKEGIQNWFFLVHATLFDWHWSSLSLFSCTMYLSSFHFKIILTNQPFITLSSVCFYKYSTYCTCVINLHEINPKWASALRHISHKQGLKYECD